MAGGIVGAMSIGQLLLTWLIIIVCILLMGVILIQRGRGGGIGAAFGAGGGAQSAFGAKTGDVFTVITVVFAAAFILLGVIGNYVMTQPSAEQLQAQPASQVPASPSPGGASVPASPGGEEEQGGAGGSGGGGAGSEGSGENRPGEGTPSAP